MTILEAMAAKVALIVTPVGAVPKVIQHGVNGIIFPAGDVLGLAKGNLLAHRRPIQARKSDRTRLPGRLRSVQFRDHGPAV